MSKKKHPSNKRKSARGHEEGNVIRIREELRKVRYRIDKDGKRVKQTHVNTLSKDWLTNNMSDISAPPPIPRRDPPPDNVTSITKNKVSKPVSQSGNEAEAKPNKNTCVHGWLHNTSEAIKDFRHWSRLSKEIGRNRCGSEPWHKRDDKTLTSPSLERAREAAQNGHKGLYKARHKKAVSLVHNPHLNPDAPASGYSPPNKAAPICVLNQRNRNRDVVYALAPSGIPISEFITGKHKPKENAVVYTTPKYKQEWPFVDQPKSPPPTATRHWYGEPAANDNSVQVRRTPDTGSTEYKLAGAVQWFIANVEVQKWPTEMYQFAHWTKDGPVINTGAVNKACADPQQELKVFKLMFAGLERQYRMLDIALEEATQEAQLWRMENQANLNEIKLLEYDLAHRTGDIESADEIGKELNIIKAKTPVPDDVDSMLFMYNTYRAFARYDGEETAFARYVWGDPALGKVMRDHAEMRCQERQQEFEQREQQRKAEAELKQAQAEFEQQKYDEYVNFWKQQYPVYLKQRARRNISAVRDPSRESVALAAIARKGKPATHRSSLYYSTLDNRAQYLTDAVAKHILSDVKPTRCRYNNPRLVEHDTRESWAQPTFKGISKYEQWWAQWLDYCELEYQKKAHPIRVGIVKTYNRLVDTLNTPVDPATRSRHKQLREQMKLKQHELDEKREHRKEERAEAKRRKAEREHIRKMQRLAH